MADLVDWQDIDAFGWPNLVTGNGFSVCTDRVFLYPSLRDYAHSEGVLTTEVQDIFTRFNTPNFEEVLDRLHTAKIILTSLGYTDISNEIETKYDLVKNALIECVNRLHPAHNTHVTRLQALNGHLASYDKIFTTNYDLLLYWAVMENETPFVDYFWNPGAEFDEYNTTFRGTARKCHIHYLHGALHLFKTNRGIIRKISATRTQSLLERITENIEARELPLFISEGDFQKKLQKVRSSDYLNFCLDQLSETNENVLVFGHTLDPRYDRHILDGLKQAFERCERFGTSFRIAVSIYNNDQNLADSIELILNQHLSRNIEKYFFRSETHPISLAGRAAP